MLTAIQQLFDYDAWATQLLLQDLQEISADEYTREGTADESIRDLVAELMSVQWHWVSRFSARQLVAENLADTISAEQVATAGMASEQWLAVREQTVSFLNGLSQEAVVSDWPVNDTAATGGNLALWKLLLHVAVQGIHLRARIACALQSTGRLVPDMGLIQLLLPQPAES